LHLEAALQLFLIILNILSCGGRLFAILSGPSGELRDVIIIASIITVNLISAWFLYNKATSHRVEWTLFGLCGNLNAVFTWWIVTDILKHWRKGKRFFS
jgi:hypothetical protein